ncbi:gag-pol fusion protein-like protein [Dinothrombium tinctorium]|uniref:Gag-pol fusion protein-like protein n=2 Tax=Dinothrombium tinctorium TaxID=1965070 RepID=A0A3S3P2U3_9ACAR|nr:gag-pol fusion protein-like protein [Dinothrombium tinctorium]
MFKDIVKWVTSCSVCQKTKIYKRKSGKLEPIRPGSRPFSRIGLDIIGMLPTTSRGNRFILVATCYLTKFAITKPVKHVTAKDVAEFLLHEVILRYSVFDEIISDNGVQFRSDIIRELNLLFNSHHKFTTPYKPSTAGLVERCNRQLIQLLKSFTESTKCNWDVLLPFVTHIYNISFHSSTKFNPFYLVHGYEAKLPIDMYIENEFKNVSKDDYVYQIAVNLQKSREIARKNIEQSQKVYKSYYDKNKDSHEFNIGDKCLIKYPIKSAETGRKFSAEWIGPLTVVHKVNNLVYELESDDGTLYFDRIHISKMRPFKARENELSEPVREKSKRIKKLPKYLSDYYLKN